MFDPWRNLTQPIVGLSPMDGVGDQPFRTIQAKYGRPDLIYTEFSRVEGICRAKQPNVLQNFLFDSTQQPIIAQIYGVDPSSFRQVAIVACQLGFAGVDINMGCPSRGVAGGGAGAGLIRAPHLAQEIVRATKAGVRAWVDGATVRDCPGIHASVAAAVEARQAALPNSELRYPIPVSVKTRIGYDEPDVRAWIETLLAVGPAAIALHGRTLSQRYSGQADWDAIGHAAEIARGSGTFILGNGDVKSRADGVRQAARYHLDGVLIGRAAMGDPFVFRTDHRGDPDHRLASIAVEHSLLFEATYADHPRYRFVPMRKHLNAYARRIGLPTKTRVRLLHTHSPDDVRAILHAALEVTPEEGWAILA
jgi:tRNA-dihydrouridine synthase